MRSLVVSALLFCLFPLTALAQTAVPDFRYFVTQDMDFYGSDLDALFDTDLDSCERACSSNASCNAFTFNSRSNSCFPKSSVSDRTAYEGAVSAEKRPTDPAVLAQAEARSADLAYLGKSTLDGARSTGLNIGFWHRAGTWTLQQMVETARTREAEGNLVSAMRWTGGAVSASDRADLWAEYARLNLAIKTDNSNDRNRYERRARSASINAYLRASNNGARASALLLLSEALDRNGRGRDMIPTLRLAQSLQPRDDIVAALDDAVGKYGFRVADTSVESDVAAPRICAQFNEPLIRVGTDYEPFVQLPEQGLSVQSDDRNICIEGVEHGKRYTFTLREGLPAASGETLYKDTQLTLYVRDRSPAIRFPGRSYVLPKSADAALPVETVNLTELNLQLRRISDRNLLRAIQNDYFGRPLSQYQDSYFASEIAEEVWTGTAEVQTTLNRDVTTRLPMGEALRGLDAGIYALTARIPGADPYDDPGATQWFVLSDLGLTTMEGNDGLHVSVRGLSDATPREGIKLTLVSRANAVLGTTTTDADGNALFDPGLTRGTSGAAPAVVFAEQGDQDIGFLSLTDPAFDLSDRGVEGRAPAGPVDVFLTTDRGAYRAGETINATVLTRDPEVEAIEGLPVIAILKRPDGVEYSRNISDGGRAGGHVFNLPVGVSVPRGSWRLDIVTDPDGPVLATQTVLVEDFLPERIDFDMSLPSAALRPGDSPPLTIEARYLFGAPGADLGVEGDLILRATRTVEEWPGYQFGRYDERPSRQRTYFGVDRTDAQGRVVIPLDVPFSDGEGMPMQATVVARVSDGGGRPVERNITTPVRPDGPIIGIKPLFDDVVPEGTEAAFDVVGLNSDLSATPMQVEWTLNRVTTRYQWYQEYGNWNWEPVTRRKRIARGKATLGTDPITLSQPVDWGRYELVVERQDGAYTSASVDFYASWYAPADSSATPDRLELSLDATEYQAGDTANLRIVPRFAGTAMVTVMADKVIARQAVEVSEGENLIPLEVNADWGIGAYVTATVIRPMDMAAGQNPARALGLAYAKVQPEGRALSVSLDAPEVANPRQSQRIAVQVDGASADSDVWLTLAAVDVGILNLTGFESPDPSDYYFGQRRLGVEMRDVYGRLIDGMNGAMGTVRSGGDATSGSQLQSPPPTQDLMSVFSGPVQTDANGAALVNVDLPAFNGTVRLMAVAWTREAVGQAERDMIVRDPVVVTPTVPRFMAPGDESRVLLEVVHADGPSGQMQLALQNVGSGIDFGTAPAAFMLADNEKKVFSIPVLATTIGDPSFDVVLTTPEGKELRQTLRLPVRANDPVVATTRRFTIGAGDDFSFSSDVFSGLRPGTASALLSAGPIARFDAPGLLSALDRYPYGCTEQVTSGAMPLLYLSSVAQASGLGDGPDVQKRVDAAIDRVLSRQAPNGAFGLWRPSSGDMWLDAYVSDFLGRARAEGFTVPDLAFRSAMDNLRNHISYAPDFDEGGGEIAYALMVLAREGAASMGDLRYYADIKGDAFTTPMGAAQLGAALASYGDQTRADAMFARASRMIAAKKQPETALWRADYGTNLRDSAGVLALATEAGSTAVDTDALLTRVSAGKSHLSTQEASWSLLAAQALLKNPESSGLLVDGQTVDGPFVQLYEDTAGNRPVTISAQSGRETAITLTTLGVPEVAPDAGGTGYAIRRQYFSMEGEELDGVNFKVGQRFVTVLTVSPFEYTESRLMIDDPLPAGIEIDNPSLIRSGDIGAMDWLDPTEARHSEFRSDRFLAAVDWRGDAWVTLAYVARAVSPGNFHHPAAAVEDMYRPTYRARGATGRVTITE
ncbi:MAG: alpha-2-macroglobulin family protein [Paracoccaceae bacterium]